MAIADDLISAGRNGATAAADFIEGPDSLTKDAAIDALREFRKQKRKYDTQGKGNTIADAFVEAGLNLLAAAAAFVIEVEDKDDELRAAIRTYEAAHETFFGQG